MATRTFWARRWAGLFLLWTLAFGAGCGRAPLDVPVESWTGSWPAGELPPELMGYMVLQQPRDLFDALGPEMARLGLSLRSSIFDPSGRDLTRMSGAVWLDPDRFEVPMVLAFDIRDPQAVVAWQGWLRNPLAAVGATSVWAPEGFDADAVFRRGAKSIPDGDTSMLYLRLTPDRMVSAFDPGALKLGAPYLLGLPGDLGSGPAARLRIRPGRLHRTWADLIPDRTKFWATGAGELKRRTGSWAPPWLGPLVDGLARLMADVRWLQVDLLWSSPKRSIQVRLAFEAGSGPARWLAGLPPGSVPMEKAWAHLGLDQRLLGSGTVLSAFRESDHLRVQIPLGPLDPGS